MKSRIVLRLQIMLDGKVLVVERTREMLTAVTLVCSDR